MSYKITNISNGLIGMKNPSTLQNFVMKTDIIFCENLSRSSLAEKFDPADKNDPYHAISICAWYRCMIYRGADNKLTS